MFVHVYRYKQQESACGFTVRVVRQLPLNQQAQMQNNVMW